MTVTLVESRPVSEALTPAEGPGRLLVQLITPGWGSSGYYSQDVLEAAGRERVWPAGTHMYIDHPSESEAYDRPERTVKDLAAVLTEDARWDDTTSALVAEARVFSQWRAPLAEMADAIGVSIRGSAEGELGEAEGRKGRVFSRLVAGESVDFVTRAGRGGKVLQVLESARSNLRESRNVGQWVESRIHRDFTVLADEMFGDGRLTREERITLSGGIGDALAAFVARIETDAPGLYQRDLWDEPPTAAARAVESAITRGVAEATANDRREQLAALVKDTYGGDNVWHWVRDFDDQTVWFDIDGGDEGGTFQQQYATTDDVATALTGNRVEVRARTTYVPVATESAPEGRLRAGEHVFSAETVRKLGATPAAEPTSPPKTTSADPAKVREAASAAEPHPPAVEAGSTPPHKKETPMGTIQVDEARYAGLEEKAALVPALEARATAAENRAEEAEQRALQAEAGTYARDFARTLVTKANGDLAEASVTRIVKTALSQALPLDESGRLDTEAFTPTVEAARTDEETYLAQVAEASGVGSVRGVGPTSTTTAPVSEADVDKAVAGAFGRKGA